MVPNANYILDQKKLKSLHELHTRNGVQFLGCSSLVDFSFFLLHLFDLKVLI